jgi:hypothetical protein
MENSLTPTDFFLQLITSMSLISQISGLNLSIFSKKLVLEKARITIESHQINAIDFCIVENTFEIFYFQ